MFDWVGNSQFGFCMLKKPLGTILLYTTKKSVSYIIFSKFPCIVVITVDGTARLKPKTDLIFNFDISKEWFREPARLGHGNMVLWGFIGVSQGEEVN